MANFFDIAETVKADFLQPNMKKAAEVIKKTEDEDVHIEETEIDAEEDSSPEGTENESEDSTDENGGQE